ncbi:MAG: peptide chain release factor N(5)-glutamine methyltransferase [Clostridioides sp.]|jgi:release factor glutamine methyltransferase|nr:peptide chain release factor N(5)-glutamine methyltransferase [Clostridioides sp.]
MTIRELITKYSAGLEDISDTPRLDVEMLLSRALGDVDRIYIHMNIDKELEEDIQNKFTKMYDMRKDGRPIAYILGNREFMGLDFHVEEGVLIPRPDTEPLIEELIEIFAGRIQIVDIGTGSGAITVSLAKYLPESRVLSLDISDKPLEVGARNAEANGVADRVQFLQSNMFSAIENSGMVFDLIVSNPPYIRREDIKGLQKQVKDFEPILALDGGTDGLDFYRDITRESKKYLKKGGILAYEVGHDQAEEVSEILKSNGYKKIYTKKDLSGIDRVVIGHNL